MSAAWACPTSASPTVPTPVPNAAFAVAGCAVPCDDGGGGGSAASFSLLREGSRKGSREMTVAVAISFPKAMARRANMCWIA